MTQLASCRADVQQTSPSPKGEQISTYAEYQIVYGIHVALTGSRTMQERQGRK